MMQRTKLILTAFLLANQLLPAQEALSPEKAVELALKNNYAILIARNDQLSVEAGTTRGNAGMLPRLDINGGGNVQSTNINQRFSNGLSVATTGVSSNATNASAVLGWTLFDGGKMFLSWDRLKEQQALSGVQLRDAIEQNMAEVLDAYFQIIRLQQEVKSRTYGLDIAEEQLLITRRKVEIGSSSRQETLQVIVDRNTAKSQLLLQHTARATLARCRLSRRVRRRLTAAWTTTGWSRPPRRASTRTRRASPTTLATTTSPCAPARTPSLSCCSRRRRGTATRWCRWAWATPGSSAGAWGLA